jgi:hypothetical protein
MMYVRGDPGDFDSWAAGGATGRSYAEVLPYFRKSEGLAASSEIVIDALAHNTTGPLGVSADGGRMPYSPKTARFGSSVPSTARLQSPLAGRGARSTVARPIWVKYIINLNPCHT